VTYGGHNSVDRHAVAAIICSQVTRMSIGYYKILFQSNLLIRIIIIQKIPSEEIFAATNTFELCQQYIYKTRKKKQNLAVVGLVTVHCFFKANK
jgi:hypothetical protein